MAHLIRLLSAERSTDVEGNHLTLGRPSGNWRKQLDVATNAVEQQQGYAHARSSLTANAQRLAVDLYHFERERKLSVIACTQALCGDSALHLVRRSGLPVVFTAFRPVPLCVLCDRTQVLAQDLAHVRLRQDVEKPHLLRHLVGRKLPRSEERRVG